MKALVAGGVGMSTVSTLRGEVDEVADEHLISVEEAGALKGNITANAHDVVRHLYVFDGDLQSQDKVAATIAGRKETITKAIEELESHISTAEQKRAFHRLQQGARRLCRRLRQGAGALAQGDRRRGRGARCLPQRLPAAGRSRPRQHGRGG